MKLLHHGLSIELADDDPRVHVIEALLFGRPLPPPMPMPSVAAASTPEKVAERPAVDVRPEVRTFWNGLTALDRRELLMLADSPRKAEELEKALGYGANELAGRHSLMARRAVEGKVGTVIRPRGRGRSGRRYYVSEELAAQFRALAAERVGGS